MLPKRFIFSTRLLFIALGFTLGLSSCGQTHSHRPNINTVNSLPRQWNTLHTQGEPIARHEAGFVAFDKKLYLIGGRGINPTSIFDTTNNTWTNASPTPIELHHFQPVVVDDAIYIIGAMTGQWPNETPLDRVIIYYPNRDEYSYSHHIPEHRRRGGAGTAVYNGKIYFVGGITNGHMDGYKPWLDEYDPQTGEWRVLPDAPNARDHFQAVISDHKLYAFAGRTTSKVTNQDMALTTQYGNIYNLKRQQWEAVTESLAIPTPRAGNAAIAWNNHIIIGSGESMKQVTAHSEVEVFNTQHSKWITWPSLQRGRHGSGFAVVDDNLYIASGSGNRGGEPELTSIERLRLPPLQPSQKTKTMASRPVYQQWHTVSLSFEGPYTAENADENPFLDYQLRVVFTHQESQQTIRGFYAADGDAAETGASDGNIWKARFTPDKLGVWSYSAMLYRGKDIALNQNPDSTQRISLANASGQFIVEPSDKTGTDFRGQGRLGIHDGFFHFIGAPTTHHKRWLKVGANSPENILGYTGFDQTYRIKAEARKGEAAAPLNIHKFLAHTQDWQTGNPFWQGGKGKSLIGAINYLASKGMNSVYFLTLNILGDGKDVWPYAHPDDFSRFDVSKLAQWEIVFQHMQAQGILLHMVLQETENETLLDKGEMGPQRQLYFNELITRFGHHLGLIWNLGEENGPASWSPIGQNTAQRKAMAKYIKTMDPYQHPVVLHTHADDALRGNILNDLLGFPYLDGLSLQQAERTDVHKVITHWKKTSKNKGKEWLITMDEIGLWHTGALPDPTDPHHNTLRQHVLWGALLSGGAGVEWYFGAQYPHNDLTSEDWRQRDKLWNITRHAKNFFNRYLPYWTMSPQHNLINIPGAYCLQQPNTVYAVYLPRPHNAILDLRNANGQFSVRWFNPRTGGNLQEGSITMLQGGKDVNLGQPPKDDTAYDLHDWVVLLKKQSAL